MIVQGGQAHCGITTSGHKASGFPIPFTTPHSSSPSQEAKEVQEDTGGAVPPGAASTDNQADEWEDANQGLTWEAYGNQSKVPPGFVLNDGVDYVPFKIQLPSGELKGAQYIKIE